MHFGTPEEFQRHGVFVALIVACAFGTPVNAAGQVDQTPQEFVLDKRGAIEVILVPQESPDDGLVAAKIVLRVDTDRFPDATIVTLSDLAIEGNVHQVFLPDSQSRPVATPHVGSWDVESSNLAAWDSYLLIRPEMVGYNAGAGFGGITETPHRGFPDSITEPYKTYGDLHFASPTDVFAMARSFQLPQLDLAYVVAASDIAAEGETMLRMRVLLEGLDLNCSCGGRNDEQWGVFGSESLAIFSVVPESSLSYQLILGTLWLIVRHRALNRANSHTPFFTEITSSTLTVKKLTGGLGRAVGVGATQADHL